jgi:hypothetical protein
MMVVVLTALGVMAVLAIALENDEVVIGAWCAVCAFAFAFAFG